MGKVKDSRGDLRYTRAFRKWNIIPEDVSKSSITVLSLERRGAEKHLVDQNPQGPPIDCARMTTALDDFGSNVFFSANERIGAKVGDAGFGVDDWKRSRGSAVTTNDHCRYSTWI